MIPSPPLRRRRSLAAAKRRARGVCSITYPPSITHTKCAGGEDWLELALYLHHDNFAWLDCELEAAKERAEAPDAGTVEIEIGDQTFVVLPGAATVGSDNKQLRYRWRLQAADGWVLLLMRRATAHATMPNAIARASSLTLLRLGTKYYEHQVYQTLEDLHARLVKNKVSRVDPCADLSDQTIDSLYRAYVDGHCVTRARQSAEHLVDHYWDGYRVNRQPTGFRVGKGSVLLRVYDKSLETRNDSEKLILMQTRRWGGLGGHALRAEFQVRRSKLKELGVDTLQDWYAKRGSVVEYLSTKWCRMTAGPIEASHPDRTATHPDWQRVQGAFAEWAGEPIAQLAPLPKLEIPADDLLNQIVGALTSYHARRRCSIQSNEAFLDKSLKAIKRAIGNRQMAEEVRQRALKLGVSGR